MVRSRDTRRQKQIKANLRAARLQPCARCGQEIDYEAPPSDPNSFSAGHIKPFSLYPHLREDPANYQQEHLGCNTRAGNRADTDGHGLQSRAW